MVNIDSAFAVESISDSIQNFQSIQNIENTYSLNTPSIDAWTKGLRTMPTIRQEFGIAQVGGKIYCIGGYNGSTYYNLVEVYDIKSDTWSTKTPMPTARAYFAITVLNGKIYCIAGDTGSGTASNVVEVYDVKTNTWTTIESYPETVYGLSATTLDGTIYVGGGRYPGDSYTIESFYSYDIDTDSWISKSRMYDRYEFSMEAVNGKIYIFGGGGFIDGPCRAVRCSNPTGLASGQVYEPSTNSWTSISSVVVYDVKQSVVVENTMYFLNGIKYTPSTNSFSSYSAPDTYSGANITYFGGNLYVLGGSANYTYYYTVNQLSDVELATIYVEISEEFLLEDDIAYATSLVNSLSNSDEKSSLIKRLKIINGEDIIESMDIDAEMYIQPNNTLSMSLSTTKIIFDDFSYTESSEKLNVLELTISSTLAYNIRSSIMSDIIGNTYGDEVDKSLINIKSGSSSSYQTFSDSVTTVNLLLNQPFGNNVVHGIDIKLSGNTMNRVDVYKTTLRFEVEQI
jgi:N-acetylneuraminic acid mutarotase